MTDLTRLVPKPDPASVNGGLSPLHQSTVLRIFGAPRYATPRHPDLSEDGPVTSARLLRAIATEDVGPFRATGHRRALRALREGLAAVRIEHPDLYAALGSAGMLCCRTVRGSRTSWSNHAFGFAVDFTVGGRLDVRGDGMVQAGLLTLYSVLKRFGWYWGTEFGVEDGMHFECSNELVLKWEAAGEL